MIKINGYFKGNMFNKETRSFEIKVLGTKENGAILCGLNVSGKDKDGNRVYGKPIDVKVNIKDTAEAERVYKLISDGSAMCECEGFFAPNNWTDKDGKEVKGNQFLVTDSTTFKVAKDEAPFEADKPKAKAKEEPEVERW